MEKEHSAFGETQGQLIRDAGWRQGSIFSPPADFHVSLSFDHRCQFLVVCSQSCAVVCTDIERDPYVELMAAAPIEKYNAKSSEATGKNLRRFHLPVSGMSNVEAVECYFYERFFTDRRQLLDHTPDPGVVVSDADARNLAGWIARNYTRIALPDALVNRARRGFFEVIQKLLRTKGSAGKDLSASVRKIYISYGPDAELVDGSYEVFLIFLCEDEQTETELTARFEEPLKPYTTTSGNDGIKLSYETKIPSQTFLSELDGYSRLTEWDYLSSLGDVAKFESK